jgi:hypothetical protein
MTREIKRLAAVMTVVTSAAFFSTLTSASPASANTDSCGSTHWPTLGESPDNCCPWVPGRRSDPFVADCN